jgi:hypothetical protein
MRLRRIIILVGPLVVALTAVPVTARAEGREGVCRQNLEKLCPNVPPGPGSVRDCMEFLCPGVTPGNGALLACLQQRADVSPACQERLTQVQAKLDASRQACKGDVEAYCADVTPGQGNIVRCLRQNYAALSPACKDQFAQHHGRYRHYEPDTVPGQ